jgi:predicted molibdopterin-dependent oxidoreductase YjgC
MSRDRSQSLPKEPVRPQMVRLVDHDRPPLAFTLDGAPATARAGDTILTAILTARRRLAGSNAGEAPRAGFCLMGACQECWVEAGGAPVRACGTLIVAGMRVTTDRSRVRG